MNGQDAELDEPSLGEGGGAYGSGSARTSTLGCSSRSGSAITTGGVHQTDHRPRRVRVAQPEMAELAS
jgi:hypothetical protein